MASGRGASPRLIRGTPPAATRISQPATSIPTLDPGLWTLAPPSGTSYPSRRQTTTPATIVATGAPVSFQPANGVFLDSERNRAGSTVQVFFGSNRVTSAGEPAERVPPGSRKPSPGRPRRAPQTASQGELARDDQPVVDDRSGCLEADDPERRRVEVHRLLVLVVRRVVGGDGIDRAVGRDPRRGPRVSERSRSGGFIFELVEKPERETSSSVSTRWCGATSQVTASPRALASRTSSSERPTDRWATCSRPPASSATSRSRATAAVSAIAGWAGSRRRVETAPSCMGAPRGERRVFRMLHDRQPEEARVLEGAPQERAVGEPLAVVGESDGAGDLHLAELGQLLALLSLRDGADRIEPRAGDAAPFGRDELEDGPVVGHRVRVRHRADGGETARRRCLQACRDRLGVLAAGLPQVRVQVDEAGQDEKPFRVQDFRVREPAGFGPTSATVPPINRTSRSRSIPAAGSTRRPPRTSSARLTSPSPLPRRGPWRAGTAPPCARRHRWRPARG